LGVEMRYTPLLLRQGQFLVELGKSYKPNRSLEKELPKPLER